jgi:hypothetical protein
MTKPFCALLAAASLLVGCGQQPDKPAGSAAGTNASTGGSVATAPADYLRGLADGKHSADKTVDTAALNKAIQLFNVDKGRNPKDLNELVKEKFIPSIPTPPYGTTLKYDADAGTVTIVQQ